MKGRGEKLGAAASHPSTGHLGEAAWRAVPPACWINHGSVHPSAVAQLTGGGGLPMHLGALINYTRLRISVTAQNIVEDQHYTGVHAVWLQSHIFQATLIRV